MNPSSNETPNLSLPSPVGEQLAPGGSSAEQGAQTAERVPSRPEQAPTPAKGAPQAQAAVAAIPLPMPTDPPLAGPTAAVSIAAASNVNEPDLIEREWVVKAKQIVERTRDDPYQQSEQLTIFKADYMKKRYDKTIKVK